MKKFIKIILLVLISFNFGALMVYFKRCDDCFNVERMLDFHYDVSVYAIKCGLIIAILERLFGGVFLKKE